MGLMWLNSMSTGVEELDSQHRKLMEIYNSLSDAIARGIEREEVARTLDLVLEYIGNHFHFEEDCFQKYQCPFAAQNKAAHEEFLKTVEGLKAEFERVGAIPTLIIRIHKTLSDWLIDHISTIDTKLRPCARHTAT